ncbi:GNAT family N-acetyltransferase [Marinibaculum pumilum]|uniref:GNAT family N-acetyltransferase n=1 Tax=Marinibaculum pumilum TaxID=1766165 RepID=A0ABV7L8W0_9PROT
MGRPKAGIAAPVPSIRAATPADLPAINRVIALARDSWDLPERVRRLAGRLHELGPTSFDSYEVIVAEDPEGTVRGVAVMLLRPPVLDDGGPGNTALYLEGLFVEPERGRRGIGSLLLRQVEARAREAGLSRIDLRARREAIGFFRKSGFRPLGPDDARHAMTKTLPA